MKLLRLLTGVRDDLDLQSHWWHRLLKVCSLLFVVVLGGGAILILQSDRPQLDINDVEIVANLRDFTKKASPDIVNTIPSFLALPGELGGVKKDGHVDLVSEWFLSNESFCSADLSKQAAAYAEKLNAREYDRTKHFTAEKIVEIVNSERRKLKPGEEIRYCGISEVVGFASDAIVKYKPKLPIVARRWTGIAWRTMLLLLVSSLVAMNLYFRGFVYVLCGPRNVPTDVANP
ncbi:MAG: hypothetical protein ABL961_03845 [Vicinamibacterales bacterium]